MTPPLSVQNLRKSFGSVVAARDVSVSFEAGVVAGIIGANGAGKTTFVNMITGYLRPSAGRIIFEGRDIAGLPARKVARLGVARSFQVAQLFPSLDVFDNLCVAAATLNGPSGLLGMMLRQVRADEPVATAEALMDLFDLRAYAGLRASALPQGVRKLLDIAMAVVGNPRVVMLDEPTSGISAEEKHDVMARVLGALRGRGITVLFVEHDMEIVSRFADRVLAFYDGAVFADGRPEDVMSDPKVQEYVTGAAPGQAEGSLHVHH